MCTESRARPNIEEGGAAARCEWREVEEGYEAGEEYQRKRERYLESVPQRRNICMIWDEVDMR